MRLLWHEKKQGIEKQAFHLLLFYIIFLLLPFSPMMRAPLSDTLHHTSVRYLQHKRFWHIVQQIHFCLQTNRKGTLEPTLHYIVALIPKSYQERFLFFHSRADHADT